ncbi:MAG: hypothetical protein LPK25_16165 [Cyclobacteriaceae bacterium]|nr:hypothetical protein [Cyclobacteriaceae bacterium]MDX5467911.1 hypothetical protein [Cyclobacteriaceae bacterium]
MKTTIFFWLLFLPFSLKANDALDQLFQKRDLLYQDLRRQESSEVFGIRFVSQDESAVLRQIIETDNAIIHKLRLENQIENSSVSAEIEQYKTIMLSQERDIQALKSRLTRTNYDINTASFEIRKFQHATWIFFMGTMIFCGLYLKDKISIPKIKLPSYSN